MSNWVRAFASSYGNLEESGLVPGKLRIPRLQNHVIFAVNWPGTPREHRSNDSLPVNLGRYVAHQ